MEILRLMLRWSKWVVREGAVKFWFDNWLGEGPIVASLPIVGDPNLLVHNVWEGLGWNLEVAWQLVDEEMVQKILHSNVRVREGKDVLVWQYTVDEIFSTKST